MSNHVQHVIKMYQALSPPSFLRIEISRKGESLVQGYLYNLDFCLQKKVLEDLLYKSHTDTVKPEHLFQ